MSRRDTSQPRVEQYEFGTTLEQTRSGDLCPNCGEVALWIFIGRVPRHWTRFLVEHCDSVCDVILNELDCKIPLLRWGVAIHSLAVRRSHERRAMTSVCRKCGRLPTLDDVILAADGWYHHRRCAPFRLS